MDHRIKRNVNIYHLIQFLESLNFALPIYILFGKNYIGLSYSEVALLVFLSLAPRILFGFLFGNFADFLSRKKSYIIGSSLIFISVLPFIFSKDYSLLIFASLLGGIGNAFTINTLDTFVYEDLRRGDVVAKYTPATSKAQQMQFLARVVASITGGSLFLLHPVLPYAFNATAAFICIILAITMLKEAPSKAIKTKFVSVTKTALLFLKKRKDIVYFCFVGLFLISFTDMQFGYYQPYFNSLKINSFHIGIVYSAIALSSAYGSHLAKSFLPKYTPKKINYFYICVCACTALCMLPRIPFLAFIGPLIMAIGSGFTFPNLRNYLNSQSPSEIKTSIASFGTTFYIVGSTIGLTVSGVLADHFSSTFIFSVVIMGAACAFILNSFVKT